MSPGAYNRQSAKRSIGPFAWRSLATQPHQPPVGEGQLAKLAKWESAVRATNYPPTSLSLYGIWTVGEARPARPLLQFAKGWRSGSAGSSSPNRAGSTASTLRPDWFMGSEPVSHPTLSAAGCPREVGVAGSAMCRCARSPVRQPCSEQLSDVNTHIAKLPVLTVASESLGGRQKH